jgi:peptide/nickel transport system permease protein
MTKLRAYILNKIFWFLLAFAAALFFNFYLPRLIPGNPVDAIIGSMSQGGGLTGEALKKVYEAYISEFGLDKPIYEQFLIYLRHLLQGNMGVSFARSPTPVATMISQALPWTIALQLPAIVVGWTLGNVLGALSAYKKGWFDRLIFPGAVGLSSIPVYCLSIVLLYFLAVYFKVFPVGGGYGYDLTPGLYPAFIKSAIYHYWLPFISLVLVFTGTASIGMRAMAIYELDADYVRFSRSMGISDNRIIAYIFRNAMLPQVTGLALAIGSMVGGALIAELVFSYPGIGSLLFTAIRSSDYPVIQGVTLLIMIGVLTANFLVDIAYGIIDPRIRAAESGER